VTLQVLSVLDVSCCWSLAETARRLGLTQVIHQTRPVTRHSCGYSISLTCTENSAL